MTASRPLTIDPEFVLDGIAKSLMAVVPALTVKAGWEPPRTASVEVSFAGSLWEGFSRSEVDDDGNIVEDWCAEDWVRFAADTLGRIQDIIATSTAMPWPLVMVGGRHDFAVPHARLVDGHAIEMTLGSESGPLIRFAPVPLLRG